MIEKRQLKKMAQKHHAYFRTERRDGIRNFTYVSDTKRNSGSQKTLHILKTTNHRFARPPRGLGSRLQQCHAATVGLYAALLRQSPPQNTEVYGDTNRYCLAIWQHGKDKMSPSSKTYNKYPSKPTVMKSEFVNQDNSENLDWIMLLRSTCGNRNPVC